MNDISPRQKFDDLHGGRAARLVIDGVICYPDGAQMEVISGGTCWEPDPDVYLRQLRIVSWWKKKWQIAVAEHQNFYKNMRGWAQNFARGVCDGGPGDAETKRCHRLKVDAKAIGLLLQEEMRKLEALTPKHIKERQTVTARVQQSMGQFLSELETHRP
jgi:hypothetical protein